MDVLRELFYTETKRCDSTKCIMRTLLGIIGETYIRIGLGDIKDLL